jgi:sulfide:quinone oxidoreductase
MNESKTVVILGGGLGGVVAATVLRKKLPDHHRVIVVDRERDHLFAPSLLWFMAGLRTAREIARPLSRLEKKGIEVVYGEIAAIDPATRTVRIFDGPEGHDPSTGNSDGGGRTLVADYLVVSLGADLAPEAVPGLAAAGQTFYTMAGAESLHDTLSGFDGGKIVVLTATPAYKCPAAPYEAAMLLKGHADERGVGDRTQVDLYAAEPGPMGVTGPEVSAGVRQMVESNGIRYHPEHQVTSVDPEAGRILFSNGVEAEFDVLAYVPPHRAPAVVRDSGLVDDSGWVPVDRNTLDTRFPGVYAVGDIARIPLNMGKPLPMAGVFAERQAETVAKNIAREITGKGQRSSFNGHGECFVEVGGGKAGFGRGDFYAEPTPQIKLHNIGRRWHIAKVLFEKSWFRRWL